jgi:hypothetical protein
MRVFMFVIKAILILPITPILMINDCYCMNLYIWHGIEKKSWVEKIFKFDKRINK